ncbi:MAG: tyrosine-type recombinase/integrase [Aquaticitalea sp.]
MAEALADQATIQRDELNLYLKNKGTNSINHLPAPSNSTSGTIKKPISKQANYSAPEKIWPENELEFEKYKNQLILNGYSKSTIRTYCGEFGNFLKVLQKNPAKDLSPDRLQKYILYCINTLKLEENTIHSKMNALKFYYEKVLHKEKMFFDIPRPKKPFILPNVLGENEIARLFNALSNLKHKAILFTAYSAGLRVSETTALQIKHVDSDRMQLLLKGAKGKKDRYVALSPIVLDILRAYIKKCKPRPLVYVFEGIKPGKEYSHRSAQQVFQNARKKARIQKDLTFHGLRHSFATHLLEKGVDVKYIQEILGHFDIRTTMRYLHVRREQLVNIASPLDDLFKKGGIEL